MSDALSFGGIWSSAGGPDLQRIIFIKSLFPPSFLPSLFTIGVYCCT